MPSLRYAAPGALPALAACFVVRVCLLVGLAGCSPTMHAGWHTVTQAWSQQPSDWRAAPLSPDLKYLHVSVDGRNGLMVLGGHRQTAMGRGSVWYSADGAVATSVNGRIVAWSEQARRWQLVEHTDVSWPDGGLPQPIEQTVDLMPGDSWGSVQTVQRQRLDVEPAHEGWLECAKGLAWFAERPAGNASAAGMSTYAVDPSTGEVVYGSHCPKANWCIRWEIWPMPQAWACR